MTGGETNRSGGVPEYPAPSHGDDGMRRWPAVSSDDAHMAHKLGRPLRESQSEDTQFVDFVSPPSIEMQIVDQPEVIRTPPITVRGLSEGSDFTRSARLGKQMLGRELRTVEFPEAVEIVDVSPQQPVIIEQPDIAGELPAAQQPQEKGDN